MEPVEPMTTGAGLPEWERSDLQNAPVLEGLPTDLAYLVQLSRLRRAEILTDEEFAYRKRRVLTGPLPDNWITTAAPSGAGGGSQTQQHAGSGTATPTGQQGTTHDETTD